MFLVYRLVETCEMVDIIGIFFFPISAECFLVNGQFNKALMEEQILKQTKTGFNLANYNLNNSVTVSTYALKNVRSRVLLDTSRK